MGYLGTVLFFFFVGVVSCSHFQGRKHKLVLNQINVESDRLIYNLNNGGAKHLVRMLSNNKSINSIRKTDIIQL